MKVIQNFDWSATEKKLVIFMPNYNGKRLTEQSILRMQTTIPTDQWMILIGNDNVDDDWDHLRTQNVASITLLRDNKEPRNGAFIRNYVIKRCRSVLFLQKDGEVVIEGDFIHSCIRQCHDEFGWRPGYAVALSVMDTGSYLDGRPVDLGQLSREIEPVVSCPDLSLVKEYLLRRNGQVNFISYYHYAYCVETAWLQTMHGYDEDFKYYGWEDVDMYLRLAERGVKIFPDYKCYAVHLYHPSTVNRPMLNAMAQVFQSKDPTQWRRNPERWGEGE